MVEDRAIMLSCYQQQQHADCRLQRDMISMSLSVVRVSVLPAENSESVLALLLLHPLLISNT